jgi:hypothetical protein
MESKKTYLMTSAHQPAMVCKYFQFLGVIDLRIVVMLGTLFIPCGSITDH